MSSLVDRYRQCVSTCAETDFDSTMSVRRSNAAVDEMRSMVAASDNGTQFWELLDEPQCADWLAFQLMELTAPTSDVADRCLRIIRNLAETADPAAAMGIRMWLIDRGE